MRCVLVGNYGIGNLGDEALRAYFLQYFREVDWQVVTADGEYPRLPFGLRSSFRPWWRTVRAIRQCDGVVFGGGSLFTDAESWKAPLLWWCYAFVAWWYRRPIILAFQGVGPCRGNIAKWTTGWVLLRSAYISVRDAKSLDRVLGFLGEQRSKSIIVVHTFDPAIKLFKGTVHRSAKKLIIIPRSNTTKGFLGRVQQEVAKDWDEVVVLLLEPGADRQAANDVCAIVKSAAVRTVDVRTFDVLANEVSSGSFVLTQRFHGAIAALANGVPFHAVPQQAGDKMDQVNGCAPEHAQVLLQAGETALRNFLRKA